MVNKKALSVQLKYFPMNFAIFQNLVYLVDITVIEM